MPARCCSTCAAAAATCPPTLCLPETMGRGGGNLPNGQAGGFLGKAYDPFALMADPSKENFKVPDLLPPPTLGDVRIDRRRRMRASIEARMEELRSDRVGQDAGQELRGRLSIDEQQAGARSVRSDERADSRSASVTA